MRQRETLLHSILLVARSAVEATGRREEGRRCTNFEQWANLQGEQKRRSEQIKEGPGKRRVPPSPLLQLLGLRPPPCTLSKGICALHLHHSDWLDGAVEFAFCQITVKRSIAMQQNGTNGLCISSLRERGNRSKLNSFTLESRAHPTAGDDRTKMEKQPMQMSTSVSLTGTL